MRPPAQNLPSTKRLAQDTRNVRVTPKNKELTTVAASRIEKGPEPSPTRGLLLSTSLSMGFDQWGGVAMSTTRLQVWSSSARRPAVSKALAPA